MFVRLTDREHFNQRTVVWLMFNMRRYKMKANQLKRIYSAVGDFIFIGESESVPDFGENKIYLRSLIIFPTRNQLQQMSL